MIAIVFLLIFLGLLAVIAGACVNSTEGVLAGVVFLIGAVVVLVVLKVRGWQ